MDPDGNNVGVFFLTERRESVKPKTETRPYKKDPHRPRKTGPCKGRATHAIIPAMNQRSPTPDGKLRVTCPDCGCDLVVDTATGTVLAHKSPKRPSAAEQMDFDKLLAGLDDSKTRADEVFNRELSALEDRDRLLEEKFREALLRAEEEDDGSPPERPWDLD